MWFNIRKKNNPNKKQAEDLNTLSSKQDIQMNKKHMIRISTLLSIREMQIKIIVRYHFTLVRMAITKNVQANVREGVE